MENININGTLKEVGVRLLSQISSADSMIEALTAGARGEGYILGLEACGVLLPSALENMHLIFRSALDERLQSLISVD